VLALGGERRGGGGGGVIVIVIDIYFNFNQIYFN